MLRFTSTGLARGDQPNPITARGMYDDQDATERIHAQRDESDFAFSVKLLDRQRHRTSKHLLRVSEADLVLLEVRSRLVRVELDFQCAMLCIFNAYIKLKGSSDS